MQIKGPPAPAGHAPEPPEIAIFGGSFNPVHEGHVALVRALAADPAVRRVLVVPTHRSPFKGGGTLLPAAVRWALLRRALGGIPRVSLSDIELRRDPPSYTVETLHTLAALLPRARLSFALGWDAFADFRAWYRAGELLALAGLIVFDRAGQARGMPAAPAAWAALLPAPWNAQARPLGDGRLVDAQGRVLLRHVTLPLPRIAAREILVERSLEGVPESARPLLAAYWRDAPPEAR